MSPLFFFSFLANFIKYWSCWSSFTKKTKNKKKKTDQNQLFEPQIQPRPILQIQSLWKPNECKNAPAPKFTSSENHLTWLGPIWMDQRPFKSILGPSKGIFGPTRRDQGSKLGPTISWVGLMMHPLIIRTPVCLRMPSIGLRLLSVNLTTKN